FEDGDIRKSLFEIEKNPSDAQMYQLYRYKKFHNLYPDEDGDIVLMRSSEQLLIEAESNARLNRPDNAVTLLNELRGKRNLSPLSAGDFTQETLIDHILLERRHELWGEGFRLYDILRTQTAPLRRFPEQTFVDVNDDTKPVKGHWVIKFPDGSDLSPNSEYFLFPIPLNEINNNPTLK
ncbi:MAG: RagB/SusD family nutrient uptake outer membrane protein, partial [Tannerella sp.]|nr:RagB/SusD family nutrient uptake outer membrane protein [Tannerella sp.]